MPVSPPRVGESTNLLLKKLVTATEGISGGGGGAVDSVNGQTGVVVLDAADVDALPASLTELIVEFTGKWRTPQSWPLVFGPVVEIPSGVAIVGPVTYGGQLGPSVASIDYTEADAVSGDLLISVDFINLDSCPSFNFYNCTALQSISAPVMRQTSVYFGFLPALTLIDLPAWVGGPNADFYFEESPSDFTINVPVLAETVEIYLYNTGITSLNLPALSRVYGDFYLLDNQALASADFSALTEVNGQCYIVAASAPITDLDLSSLETISGNGTYGLFVSLGNLTSLDLSSLVTHGNQMAIVNTPITVLSAPNLETIGESSGSSVQLLSNELTDINFPAMVSYAGGISQSGANATNVVLGTVGTLKSVGGDVGFFGNKLTAASVNGILALLVSLDGTNGTTLYGAGKSVILSGGTNAAPTGQGILDAATLSGRGATVSTN